MWRRRRRRHKADDEASRRQKGLETPLDASNKGFEMLRKMGYEGGGLGKDGAGIEQPLATETRRPRDTQGVGIPQAARRAQLSWEAARRHVEQRERTDFAQHNQRRFSDRACLKASRRARSACRDLDERKGLRWTPIWPSDEAHPQRSFADASGAVYAQPGTYLETGQNDGIGGLDEEAPEVALRTAVAYLRDCHGALRRARCARSTTTPDLEAELAARRRRRGPSFMFTLQAGSYPGRGSRARWRCPGRAGQRRRRRSWRGRGRRRRRRGASGRRCHSGAAPSGDNAGGAGAGAAGAAARPSRAAFSRRAAMTRARADGRLCLTTTGPCCGLAPAALRRSLIVFCDLGPWALPMMSVSHVRESRACSAVA